MGEDPQGLPASFWTGKEDTSIRWPGVGGCEGPRGNSQAGPLPGIVLGGAVDGKRGVGRSLPVSTADHRARPAGPGARGGGDPLSGWRGGGASPARQTPRSRRGGWVGKGGPYSHARCCFRGSPPSFPVPVPSRPSARAQGSHWRVPRPPGAGGGRRPARAKLAQGHGARGRAGRAALGDSNPGPAELGAGRAGRVGRAGPHRCRR